MLLMENRGGMNGLLGKLLQERLSKNFSHRLPAEIFSMVSNLIHSIICIQHILLLACFDKKEHISKTEKRFANLLDSTLVGP